MSKKTHQGKERDFLETWKGIVDCNLNKILCNLLLKHFIPSRTFLNQFRLKTAWAKTRAAYKLNMNTSFYFQ